MNEKSHMESLPSAPSRFRGEVLNKVYRVWLFRRLVPVLAIEIALLAFLLYEIGKRVFVERVIENAMKVFFVNPSGFVSFFISAFFHASRLVELVIIVFLIAGAFLIRHITQGILRFILVRGNYFGKIRK